MVAVSQLNERQREAVLHGDGPLLVLAGAGSGKTRVITTRIARLIDAGTRPDAILALTFTNKAAGEMRRRLEGTLGPIAADVWISTFHSAAARVLRRHIGRLGYSERFSIYDDQDRAKLIRQCMAEENVGEHAIAPAIVAWAIDRAKNEALGADEVARRPRFGELVARLYRRYQAALERQNALDFADLLLLAVRLFREHPDVLAGYHARLRHVLVDEYQDTNRSQYLWLRQLAAGDEPNLCVVGDDDQSIYGWRGAELRNILDFERDFPTAHVIRLEQNYRSTKTILAAAGAVVANNQGRKGKTLWTANPAGDPVRLVVAEDDLAEARLAIAEVRRLVAERARPRRDRRLLSDQRPVACDRGSSDARRPALHDRRRHPLLRAQGDQGSISRTCACSPTPPTTPAWSASSIARRAGSASRRVARAADGGARRGPLDGRDPACARTVAGRHGPGGAPARVHGAPWHGSRRRSTATPSRRSSRASSRRPLIAIGSRRAAPIARRASRTSTSSSPSPATSTDAPTRRSRRASAWRASSRRRRCSPTSTAHRPAATG